jgi:Mn2+/Fe2+ NRAMP family transporter
MLLIIGIVGTTVAPWQLFFQQSYIIDKRITPRFMNYEKADLWIGIVIVIVGRRSSSRCPPRCSPAPRVRNFTDAGGVAAGIGKYVGRVAGILFAIALIDASIIGAAAVGLSTSYALGDTLGLKHSLHRKVSDAKGFYAAFAGLLIVSAIIVVIPGSPLGLITVGCRSSPGCCPRPPSSFCCCCATTRRCSAHG